MARPARRAKDGRGELLARGLRGHVEPCAAVPGLARASSRGAPKRLRPTLCSDLIFGFPPVGREKDNDLRPVQGARVREKEPATGGAAVGCDPEQPGQGPLGIGKRESGAGRLKL
jgi:hypothetical protein